LLLDQSHVRHQTAPAPSRVGIRALQRVLGVSARAIRFYEERGLIEAARDRCGARLFDEEALQRLWVVVLLRRAGISLHIIARILEGGEAGDGLALRALADAEEDAKAKISIIQGVREQLHARGRCSAA
jgi:DNA-binding transcriptional MerR regulator